MFLPGIEQELIQISKLVTQIQPDRLTVLSDISSKKLQDLGIPISIPCMLDKLSTTISIQTINNLVSLVTRYVIFNLRINSVNIIIVFL